jgi:TonB family protein
MTLYALRLLVALLTFAVGIAAAWLFGFKSAPAGRGFTNVSYVVTSDVPPAEPSHSCPLERRRVIRGGILQGKAISKPQPAYPPDAKAARVSGTVAVEIIVDESGRVESARAVSGPGLLQEAAVEAALSARFSPTLLSGQPVKVSGVITYNFVLQ